MKKITSLLLAVVASLCSLTARAEREAPTMPTPCVPDSGGVYVLYNVETRKELNSYNSVGYHAMPVKVHITDGVVRFQMLSESGFGYYMQGWGGNGGMSWASWSDSYVTWQIASAEANSYRIRNERTSAEKYLGVSTGDNTSVYWDRDSAYQVHWYFFEEDAGTRYAAERRLYDALENNDTTSLQYAARGWDFSYFENLYADRANHTPEELNSAADGLRNALTFSAAYQAPWWNEAPILFFTDDKISTSTNDRAWVPSSRQLRWSDNYTSDYSISLSAIVTLDEPSTLYYGLYSGGNCDVFVDGIQKRHIDYRQFYRHDSYLPKSQNRFFEHLTQGMHIITWKINGYFNDASICDVGVLLDKDVVVANLLRPGSLGTEVLYAEDINDLKNVRRLKVKGEMNSDDWKKLKMMSRLQELDLSEAVIKTIPEKQFQINYGNYDGQNISRDTTLQFLHRLILPEGVEHIGHKAFNHSIIEELIIPSTVTSIEGNTFYGSHIKELYLPDNLINYSSASEREGRYTNSYSGWFDEMYFLEKVKLPRNLKRIPGNMFSDLYYLRWAMLPDSLETVGAYAFAGTDLDSLTLPKGTTTIETYAFKGNTNLKKVTLPKSLKSIGDYAFYGVPANMGHLPSSLTSIGTYAFANCTGIDSLFVPNNVTSIGTYAFSGCTGVKYAELGTGVYSLSNSSLSCANLKTLKLLSPSVVNAKSGDLYSIKGVDTLLVPHYLWASYKLDEYWYNAQHIVPFDYENMEFIPIRSTVELGHERFGGKPSIALMRGGALGIYGDMAQQFQDVTCYSNNYGVILNECNNITVSGDNKVFHYMGKGYWYFVSFPFDVEVNKISVPEGIQYAIRYYDGAGRASNGKTGNWKNFGSNDTIPAGMGFIMQTSGNCNVTFNAADTDKKYNTFTTTEVVTPLALNASETRSNSGWNLVGNPYQCYYNNHMLNFTGPITIWNWGNKTYTAYSLTDDDYAIRPNEAFFVQCPGTEMQTISFPLQGRQLTDVIESQNAVKAMQPQADGRRLIDLTLSRGDVTDRTRVVFNPEAGEEYETRCDAGKFMSMETSVQQVYTLDEDGNRYAINERPEGTVRLGFYAGENGAYTFSAVRNTVGDLYLTDLVAQKTVNLRDEDYTFDATAGTDEARFVLTANGNADGIAETMTDEQTTGRAVYDLQGRRVETTGRGAYIVNGKKLIIK